MSHLDNLIGSQLSLISQVDVRYDGILFSINAQESSIVLQKVRCLGTEDRVTDPSKKVPPSDSVIPFVTFPGHEIKDLYVHDVSSEPAAAPAPSPAPAPAASESLPAPPPAAKSTSSAAPPRAPQQGRGEGGRGKQNHQQQSKPATTAPAPAPASAAAPANATNSAASSQQRSSTSAGTGEHLLRMRLKKTEEGNREEEKGEFDFQAGLSHFNKNEVLASVASQNTEGKKETKYVKDDFFDSLSCDVLDRAEGRSTRLNNQEERALNADTFGAIAVQSNFRRGYRGRGGGRGGGYYNNSGGSGGRGGRGYNNGGNYRGGSRGRGRHGGVVGPAEA